MRSFVVVVFKFSWLYRIEQSGEVRLAVGEAMPEEVPCGCVSVAKLWWERSEVKVHLLDLQAPP